MTKYADLHNNKNKGFDRTNRYGEDAFDLVDAQPFDNLEVPVPGNDYVLAPDSEHQQSVANLR